MKNLKPFWTKPKKVSRDVIRVFVLKQIMGFDQPQRTYHLLHYTLTSGPVGRVSFFPTVIAEGSS